MTVDDLLDELSALSITEALDLVKKLENRWGVSGLRRISRLFTPFPDMPKTQQTEFDVILNDCGIKKIEVIKVIRTLIPGCGLKEAKDASENFGCAILQSVNLDTAIAAKNELERAGAKATIQ
jgi:large subunit ribosomal protein L7/L12